MDLSKLIVIANLNISSDEDFKAEFVLDIVLACSQKNTLPLAISRAFMNCLTTGNPGGALLEASL